MLIGKKMKPGSLFGSCPEGVLLKSRPRRARGLGGEEAGHPLAFAGLFLFTLLLYLRPNELFPDLFGELAIMKFVAITTLIVYIGGKLGAGELLTIWPAEMCALALIVVIGIVITPVAASPQHSIDMLSDTFFKVVVIFILMINLVDTRERLLRILKLVVICGAGIAAGSIWKFAEGKFTATVQGVGIRIEGAVGGIFGNPNDLAMALDMLLPLSIVLMLSSKSAERLLFLVCTFLLAMGVVVSFSRGGFLGLAAACGVLMWKLGRHNKFTTALAVMGACLILALSMPAGYADRLFTIVQTDKDTTGSARERQDELKRVTFLAVRHPVIGIGLNNYPVYSNHAIRAHNSFLEVAAELGVLGLIAYLILILAPLKRLKQIERETSQTGDPASRELHFLGAGVQAAIIGYVVCAVFSSAQYQWYLYYPVAYAVALKRIHDATRPAEQKSSPAKPKRRLNLGRLWGRGVGAEA
jgi:putative inorganic carbon (HCO3(-)) transporter